MRDPEAFPGHLKEYIENSPFEVHVFLRKPWLPTYTPRFTMNPGKKK